MKTIHLYILNKKIYYFFVSFLIFLFFLIFIFVLLSISDGVLDTSFYTPEFRVLISLFFILIFLSLPYSVPLALMSSFILFSIDMNKGGKMNFLKQSGIIGSIYSNIIFFSVFVSIIFFYYNNYLQPHIYARCIRAIQDSIQVTQTSNFLKPKFMNQFKGGIHHIFFDSFAPHNPGQMNHIIMSEHMEKGIYEINAEKCNFKFSKDSHFVFDFHHGTCTYFNYLNSQYYVMQFKSFSHKISIAEMLSFKNLKLGDAKEMLTSSKIDGVVHQTDNDAEKKELMLFKYNRYFRSVLPLFYALFFVLFCGFSVNRYDKTYIVTVLFLTYTFTYLIFIGSQSYFMTTPLFPFFIACVPHLSALSIVLFMYYFLRK